MWLTGSQIKNIHNINIGDKMNPCGTPKARELSSCLPAPNLPSRIRNIAEESLPAPAQKDTIMDGIRS